MPSLHRWFIGLVCGMLAFLGSCIMNDVIPDEQETRNYRRQLEITSPGDGTLVSPTEQIYLRINTSDYYYWNNPNWPEGTVLRVCLNDSLWAEQFFTDYWQSSLYPYQWAEPGSTIKVLARATDPDGVTATDSITILVSNSGNYQTQPALIAPVDGHVFLTSGSNTVRLEAADYITNSAYETYTFNIASDPDFEVSPLLISTTDRTSLLDNLAPGRYYWRVRATIPGASWHSPWSETRSFSTFSGTTTSPEFQSFTRIERLIAGAQGFYAIGYQGYSHERAVLKCDSQFAPGWLYALPGLADCEEMADGRVLLASQGDYSSVLTGLAADGTMIWNQSIPRSGIRAVRAAGDGAFFCGFGSSQFLVKVDSTGATQWQLSGSRECARLHTSATRDMCVMLLRVGGGAYEARAVDLDGNSLWTRTLNIFVSEFPDPFILTALADGGFLFGSTISRNYSYSIFLVRIDATGAVQWQANYDQSLGFGAHSRLGDAREGTDGDLYLVGSTRQTGYSSSDSDLMLARLAPTGAPLWTRSYGSKSESEYGTGLAVLADRLVLLGYIDAGTDAAIVLPVDTDGAVLWR